MLSPRGSFVDLLRFLAGTNLFIAACAAIFAAGILPYFGHPPDRRLAYFVFFGTLFAYNAQRHLGDLHSVHDFSRTEWTLMGFAVVGMAFGAWGLPTVELVVLGISGALSIAYAYPLVPRRGRRVSLRRLPYLKLWLIVLVWLLSCVVAPLLQAHRFLIAAHPINPLLIIIQQGAFIAALTIPFDIRDIRFDFPSQRTLPQVLGLHKARRLALILFLVSIGAALGLAFNHTVSIRPALAHIAVCLVAAAIVSRATPHRDELFFFIAIDGMLLLQGTVFLILSR